MRLPGRWLAPLAVLGLVLPLAVSAAPAGFVRVTADTVNLRARPTRESDRVRQAYDNDPLRVVGKKGAWLRVRDFEGYEGWVYRPLTDERPAVIVKAAAANIRSGPGQNHEVTYTADRGVAFLVVRRRGEWLEVQHAEGARGWIHRGLVWGAVRRAQPARRRE